MPCAPCEPAPLLALVRRDLGGWPTEPTGAGQLRLRLSDTASVTLDVCRQRLFMAHIERCEFAIAGGPPLPASGRIEALQPGWFRRQPAVFRARRGDALAPLARYLNGFQSLRQTLSELDYRRFQLIVNEEGWRCTLEPWGASLVVCRLPPLRRYIRLETHQRMLLLSALSMIAAAIARFEKASADQ